MNNHFYPTPKQFIDFVHYYTERMAIRVIIDNWHELRKIKGLKRLHDFYLTYDLNAEKERILKYYENAPLWNLHVEFSEITAVRTYKALNYVLVANVSFSDIMEGYLKEKEDNKRKKQKRF